MICAFLADAVSKLLNKVYEDVMVNFLAIVLLSHFVDMEGEPYNPPVYNSLNYTMQVTCENGIAKASTVKRKKNDRSCVILLHGKIDA